MKKKFKLQSIVDNVGKKKLTNVPYRFILYTGRAS